MINQSKAFDLNTLNIFIKDDPQGEKNVKNANISLSMFMYVRDHKGFQYFPLYAKQKVQIRRLGFSNKRRLLDFSIEQFNL